MQLIDEIINLATDDKSSIAVLLRKCLVLAYQTGNSSLKSWLLSELNGYSDEDPVPPYRTTYINSQGAFHGIGGSAKALPFPLDVLEREHRRMLERVDLRQPISAYETEDIRAGMRFDWPPTLTARYQDKILSGFSLVRAWREVPGTVLVSLLDTVRTRLLTLLLEMRDTFPSDDHLPSSPEDAEKLQTMFTTVVLGDNNIITQTAGSSTVEQTVLIGDLSSLLVAASKLGLDASAQAELSSAVKADEAEGPVSRLGRNVLTWIKKTAPKVGGAGAKISVGATEKVLTGLALRYFGLKD